MKDYIRRINNTDVDRITATLTKMKEDVHRLNSDSGLRIYNNKQVSELLNISEKVLCRYRFDGLLDYSRDGDKYWYTQDDIDNFLDRTHNE